MQTEIKFGTIAMLYKIFLKIFLSFFFFLDSMIAQYYSIEESNETGAGLAT